MNRLVHLMGVAASLAVLGLLGGMSASISFETTGAAIWERVATGCMIVCLISLGIGVVAGIWYIILDR